MHLAEQRRLVLLQEAGIAHMDVTEIAVRERMAVLVLPRVAAVALDLRSGTTAPSTTTAGWMDGWPLGPRLNNAP